MDKSFRPTGVDGLFMTQLGSKCPSSGAGWTFHASNWIKVSFQRGWMDFSHVSLDQSVRPAGL
ncbi:hypothetical protein, partial [Bacillus sp. JJ1773]|uniref:hypothetical protein n=1 Tax=Bacillus sp. JJ1773 TaxID=3122965 RepID=UPI002FFF2E5A